MFTKTQRCRWNYGIVCNVFFRHETSCYEGQYLITIMGRVIELTTIKRQLLYDSFIWRKSMLRYQPADIGCSERRTVFSRKSFKERQCPGTKIRAYFEAKQKLRVFIILRFFSRRAERNYYEQFTVAFQSDSMKRKIELSLFPRLNQSRARENILDRPKRLLCQ